MLTESCVMFFSPSHAVLSAFLQDEYLTSVVRTKEGDKAGSKQPQGRDPVQFKLELTPNYLISYLENTTISQKKRSWGYKTSFLNMTGVKISTKGIWGAHVDSNPPISVSRPNKHPCGSGLWFWTANGHDTLTGGFESTRIPQMPLVEIFAPVMLRKLVLQLQDRFSREILEGLSSHSDGAWIHI